MSLDQELAEISSVLGKLLQVDTRKMIGTLLHVVMGFRAQAFNKRRRTLQKSANKLGYYLRGGHYPDEQFCNLREKDAGRSGGPATYFNNLDEAEMHMMNLKPKRKPKASRRGDDDDAKNARLWHARNANV